ncbi:MAG: lyase family protein [Anaerolineales bacterium]
MTLWGGRFSTKLNQQAWDLNSSLPVDQRMALQDIDGAPRGRARSIKRACLRIKNTPSISLGLDTVRKEFASGQFIFQPSDEDIHTAVERRLTELIGGAAGKLHTGRSRNDQVATDFRLWMLKQSPN